MTIVFSDLKGSTAMGEKLDSESLREVMTRYFDSMSAELERHGGVVEKFIGDAIMAVFGLPKLHEDDALRAVRAAADMQRVQGELNDELERNWGVRLTVRTGVNTGEVVAGDAVAGQRLVTGDAVNVAARLEQAAGAQEVLLGDLTYRLVRDYVDVEEVEPLELKGKSEPVPAYRLVGVREGSERQQRRDSPMIGRDHGSSCCQARSRQQWTPAPVASSRSSGRPESGSRASSTSSCSRSRNARTSFVAGVSPTATGSHRGRGTPEVGRPGRDYPREPSPWRGQTT